jgi:hypothetical protein
MLGCRLTTILPAMTLAEAIETTRIHGVAGRTGASVRNRIGMSSCRIGSSISCSGWPYQAALPRVSHLLQSFLQQSQKPLHALWPSERFEPGNIFPVGRIVRIDTDGSHVTRRPCRDDARVYRPVLSTSHHASCLGPIPVPDRAPSS